jgi:hypothetical protein
MNFIGSTEDMKRDAETYLRATYIADWSAAAIARAEAEAARANGMEVDEAPKPKVPTPFQKPKKVVKTGYSAMFSLIDDIHEVGDDGDENNEHEHDDEEDEGSGNDEGGEDQNDDIEIDKYLSLPQMLHTQDGKDTDIMDWWRARQFDFPHLARMARQFLAIPASSAGPERLFHTAGRMHDDLKKCTGEDTLSHMLEINQNL